VKNGLIILTYDQLIALLSERKVTFQKLQIQKKMEQKSVGGSSLVRASNGKIDSVERIDSNRRIERKIFSSVLFENVRIIGDWWVVRIGLAYRNANEWINN
jgi:hypothetical protein